MANFLMEVKVSDLDTFKQLAAENKKLNRQLELVLTALSLEDVDVPCPSTVGLDDNDIKCFGVNCGECWKRALDEIEMEETKCSEQSSNQT